MPPQPDKQIVALEKVLQISRDMAATADLDELLGLVIERSMELLDAERASLFLYDPEKDELVTKIAAGTLEIRVPARAGIVGAVVQTRQVLNIPDAYADARFNRDVDRKTGFRTRNILAVPLLDYSGQLVGVLEVLNKRQGDFGAEDIKLFRTLAAQAGVVLQRARLMEHFLEKQRMEQALQIARQIQQDLLPKENPLLEGFDIAGWSSPADETGGDTYDFFDLGGGRWTLTLADATGHGVGPALVVAEARAMLRALSHATCSPDGAPATASAGLDVPRVMSRVNDLLARDLSDARFVTCFFGLLDGPAGSVRYVSGGQGPILIYRRGADQFEELKATAPPLGIMEGLDFSEQVQRELAGGDILAIITDGFFEACNAKEEQYGTRRLCECIRKYRDQASADIIQLLASEVWQFTGPIRQADDQTAIIVRRL